MSAPLLLLIATMTLMSILYLMRKFAIATAILAAFGAALISIFVFKMVLNEPFTIVGVSIKIGSTFRMLGRAMVIDETNRAAIGFLYLVGTAFFGCAWVVKIQSRFYLEGLLCIGLIAASLMIQPFLYAAIFLEFTAMIALIMMSPGSGRRSRGGLRLLILYTIAMIVILISGWMLDMAGVTSGTPELAKWAVALMGIGFAIIMAVPPFHIWIPDAAEECSPYKWTFVAIVLQSAGIFFLLNFLNSYTWLREDASLLSGMKIAGNAMIWFGGLWALAQDSFPKCMAYAMLADLGIMLLAVSTTTPSGYQLTLVLTGARAVSLIIWALGTSVIMMEEGNAGWIDLAKKGGEYPYAAIAITAGMLSIAGFPLTAGFPARWALMKIMAPINWFGVVALIVGTFLVGGAGIRWVLILFQAPVEGKGRKKPLGERLILAVGVVLCMAIGIFPQILAPWTMAAVAGLGNLFP